MPRLRNPIFIAPALLLGALVALQPAAAMAQDPVSTPEGQGTGIDQATKGNAELDGQGKFGAAKEPVGEEGDDATEVGVSAGGILSTGNANQAALTGALNLRLRRGNHQFSSIVLGNYGAAKQDKGGSFETTVGNVQGRVRYDYYFAKRWSVFAMLTARHDPFQQLALRMNVDPGVAFYILNKKNHRFWSELGYDFQYDLRTPEGQAIKDADGNFLDDLGNIVTSVDDAALDPDEKVFINHAARLFLGYSNHISDVVHFDTGIEYLQSFIVPEALRLNYDAAITAALSQKFSISTTFTLRFDNRPVEGVEKLDTVTAVNLAYRFL